MTKEFDDHYPTNEDYNRYNPKNKKSRKRPEYGYMTKAGKKKRIQDGLVGFSLLDYSFKDASYLGDSTFDGKRTRMNKGYYSWKPLGFAELPEGVEKWKASPEEVNKVITKAAKFYGAVSVGFTTVDERWIHAQTRGGKEFVFEDVEEGYEDENKVVLPKSHKYMVVMTVPMDYEETMYTPTAMVASGGMAYSRMHLLAGCVAEFIRGLGYSAIPSGNDIGMNVPIAIQAGLGHAGRMNRLITWERGPLVKICKIFTDLPVQQSPMAHDGILKFCETCKKCSKYCPSGSITDKPMSFETPSGGNPGIYRWYCDEDKCNEYWDEVGTSCTICFRVCAFTKKEGILHDFVKWCIKNVPVLNPVFAWADDMMGYGKMKDPRKYWDDP